MSPMQGLQQLIAVLHLAVVQCRRNCRLIERGRPEFSGKPEACHLSSRCHCVKFCPDRDNEQLSIFQVYYNTFAVKQHYC